MSEICAEFENILIGYHFRGNYLKLKNQNKEQFVPVSVLFF